MQTVVSILILTLALGADGEFSFAVREEATDRAVALASTPLGWEVTNRAANQTADPEVAHRLRHAARKNTQRLVATLLPADYPIWPDIDHAAGKQVLFDNTEDADNTEYFAYHERKDALRRTFFPAGPDTLNHNAAVEKSDDPQVWKYRNLSPQYRLATRRWTEYELFRAGSFAEVRDRLAEVVAVEKASAQSHQAGQIADDKALRDFTKKFLPAILNERYDFDAPAIAKP